MRTPSNLSTALIDDCLTALDNTAAFCEQGILRLNGFGKILRVRGGLYGVAISCTDYTTGKLRGPVARAEPIDYIIIVFTEAGYGVLE